MNEEELEKNKKSATDLLLKLIDDVGTLSKRLSTIETTLKILLANKQNKPISNSQNTQAEVDLIKEEIVQIKAGAIQISEDLQQKQRASKIASPPLSGKKIPVTQRVTWDDGKSLFMAKVEIFDENDNLLEKVNTSADGKWTAKLPIGKVKIKIHKKVSVNGQDTELQSITTHMIQNSDGALTLPLILIRQKI